MSGFSWFRLYSEIVDDPKMGRLSDFEFRIWIQLLSLASINGRSGDIAMTVEEVSWRLRCDVSVTVTALIKEQLIFISDNKTIVIKNFAIRNPISDSSKKRTRKYRENKEKKLCDDHVTSQTRHSDAIDKTRVDNKNITTNVVIQKEKLKPKKKLKRKTQYPPDFQITPMHLALAHKHDWPSPHDELEPFRNYHESHGNLFLNWDKAFYTWLRNAKKFNGRSNGISQGNGNQRISRTEQGMLASFEWSRRELEKIRQEREEEGQTYEYDA